MTRRALLTFAFLPQRKKDEKDEEYLGPLAIGALNDDFTSRVIVRRDLQLVRDAITGVLRAELGPSI